MGINNSTNKKGKKLELLLKYEIKGEDSIQIFGKKFVEKNRNNCKIKI